MSAIPVVRIIPCEQHQCPGHAFVEINECDYDSSMHELYDPSAKAPAAKKGIAELREALTAAGVEFAEDAKKADLQAMFDALPV